MPHAPATRRAALMMSLAAPGCTASGKTGCEKH
jgi:hypothetical protein